MTTSQPSRLDRARRALPAALAAAIALHPLAAAAQTGSGTVSFAFTTFSGPFAVSTDDNAFTPGLWNVTGLVNSTQLSPSGWVAQGDPSFPDIGYVTGTHTFLASTNEARLRYTHLAPGDPGENVIGFAPRAFSNVALGQDFVLGTLTFQNGFWAGGGFTAASNVPTDLGFRITTSSVDGPQFNQTIEGTVRMVVNQLDETRYDPTLPANQAAEADWIHIESPANVGSMGSFRVYDLCCSPGGFTNVGTVDLIARFNSLELVGLANPHGGFVAGTVLPLPATPIAAVPEPATWALVGSGLVVVAAGARRRSMRPAVGT